MLGEILLPGFQEIIFNPKKWKARTAWLKCEWSALARPSVDMQREAKAYIELVDNKNMTNDIVCRRFTGMGFRSVCLKLAQEKKLLKRLGLVQKVDEDSQGIPVNLSMMNNDNSNNDDERENQDDEDSKDENDNEENNDK